MTCIISIAIPPTNARPIPTNHISTVLKTHAAFVNRVSAFHPLRTSEGAIQVSVDSLHLIITDALGAIYDWIEDRYGNTIAWLVTCGFGFAIVGALCAILMAVI